MREVLVATPLKPGVVRRTYAFGDGIAVRELSPILGDISIAKPCINANEGDRLERTRYWLCASNEAERVYGGVGDDLYAKAVYAMYALQIICPSGAKNVFLKFKHTEQGYDNIGYKLPKELCSTLIGRITSAEDQGLERDFEAVYIGVKRAFTERIVRLQNPILLLEHGMQIGNASLGALMFVMALDMLLMADKTAHFVERLGGFLGPQSYVFPPDSVLHRQASVRVRDVLADLFEFRNRIAHGREIPEKPYRQRYDLLDEDGGRTNDDDYGYSDLMCEGALFLLAKALRKVFVEGLIGDIREEARWRPQLRLYEHRWKDAATTPLPNTAP